MALSPHLMQATLFGRYHAAPTNTSMIPSSRPDSVESYGVYGPFYGYQHTCEFVSGIVVAVAQQFRAAVGRVSSISWLTC
jgi:hypothetical protein